jgi:hypothetical protein
MDPGGLCSLTWEKGDSEGSMRDPCATARFPNRIHAAPITHDCPRGEAGKGRGTGALSRGLRWRHRTGLVCALLGRHGPGGRNAQLGQRPHHGRIVIDHKPPAPSAAAETPTSRTGVSAATVIMPRSARQYVAAVHAPSRLCTTRSISLIPTRGMIRPPSLSSSRLVRRRAVAPIARNLTPRKASGTSAGMRAGVTSGLLGGDVLALLTDLV